MITVGIIEEKSEIADMIKEILKNKNLSCGTDENGEDKDFLLLEAPFEKKCDIVINNCGKGHKMSKSCICLLNSDAEQRAGDFEALMVISYGLNSLATVTASSISDDGERLCFQYCLQREIVSFSGKKTEPQEFPVCFESGISVHAALAVTTFFLLTEIK